MDTWTAWLYCRTCTAQWWFSPDTFSGHHQLFSQKPKYGGCAPRAAHSWAQCWAQHRAVCLWTWWVELPGTMSKRSKIPTLPSSVIYCMDPGAVPLVSIGYWLFDWEGMWRPKRRTYFKNNRLTSPSFCQRWAECREEESWAIHSSSREGFDWGYHSCVKGRNDQFCYLRVTTVN